MDGIVHVMSMRSMSVDAIYFYVLWIRCHDAIHVDAMSILSMSMRYNYISLIVASAYENNTHTRCHVDATSMPRRCHVDAVSMLCRCHVDAMSMPCRCHVGVLIVASGNDTRRHVDAIMTNHCIQPVANGNDEAENQRRILSHNAALTPSSLRFT